MIFSIFQLMVWILQLTTLLLRSRKLTSADSCFLQNTSKTHYLAQNKHKQMANILMHLADSSPWICL